MAKSLRENVFHVNSRSDASVHESILSAGKGIGNGFEEKSRRCHTAVTFGVYLLVTLS
ncbi:hypothetical protein SBDP1_940015 [Syntrophobacter sp. SbD1]|nr:hypothetical protein SBDP1_940015 [Syntrophobacter sp. SbD1]